MLGFHPDNYKERLFTFPFTEIGLPSTNIYQNDQNWFENSVKKIPNQKFISAILIHAYYQIITFLAESRLYRVKVVFL